MSDEEIVAAYRALGSIWKAAKRIGLCGQSVHERLQRLGFPMAHQEWSRAELDEARRLAMQGEPLAQIAARLGRTYYAVALKLSRNGVGSRNRAGRWKPKHVKQLRRSRVHEFAKLLLHDGWSVRRLARREGLAVTPLVDALQTYEPAAWERYVALHSAWPWRTCPGCDARFRPLTGKQQFCTVHCRESHHRNVAYFGGRRLEAVGLREGICQLCGKESKKWLAAHHVLGRENDPENGALIALCRGCHDLVTRFAARAWVDRPGSVAYFVALALARRGKTHALVSVVIDRRSGQEILDERGHPLATGLQRRPPSPIPTEGPRPLGTDRWRWGEPGSPVSGIDLSGASRLGRPESSDSRRDGIR